MQTTTETSTSPETTLEAARLDVFSTLERLKPRPRPQVKALGAEWQRKWLGLTITHPDVQKLADRAAAFASRWFCLLPGRRWCVVAGPTGTGKTHVSLKLCDWARRIAFEAWQTSWHRLTDDNLPTVTHLNWLEYASPERCDADKWDAFLRCVRLSAWVFIDDIGTETDQYRSAIPTQRLCELLNVCDGKFLWMTTNVMPQHWAEKWDKRVEDRLLTAEVVEVNAPSYRSEV